MDIFNHSDVRSTLLNKFVVIIGDSIQRGIYKDLVLLLQENRYLREKDLKEKGEHSFLNDELIEGGRKGEMTNGVGYSEVRQYKTDDHLIRFYFVTRCYNPYVKSILNDLKDNPNPDIVVMNSCLWDITRYGKESIIQYKKNLVTLFDEFKEVLPDYCLLIWNTTLPISNKARGGFLIPEIAFRTTSLRLDILEANYYVQSLIIERDFDILDLHFYLRHHLDRRVRDGVHWDTMAHRYITNLLMGHICTALDLPRPQQSLAPFSSYPSQTLYTGEDIPSENSFNSPNFKSHQIQQQFELQENDTNAIHLISPFQNNFDNHYQQAEPKLKTDFNNNPQVVPTHPKGGKPYSIKSRLGFRRPEPVRCPDSRNPFGNLYSSWKGLMSSTLNNVMNCVVPNNIPVIDNRHNNARQEFHNSWNRPSVNYEVCQRDPYRNVGHGMPPPHNRFGGGHLHFRPIPQLDFQRSFNNYNATFQPYQQNDYQGPSHPRRRNRLRPHDNHYY